jgi:hypothetical protein
MKNSEDSNTNATTPRKSGRRGRPILSPDEKRTVTICIRVTPKQALEAQGGVSFRLSLAKMIYLHVFKNRKRLPLQVPPKVAELVMQARRQLAAAVAALPAGDTGSSSRVELQKVERIMVDLILILVGK